MSVIGSDYSTDIPAEIVDWFRDVFATANRRLTEKIRNSPAIPESHLDTTFVEHLTAYAAPRAFPSGWAIRIDTHYIGGLRHFRSWEIADVGVFVFFQRDGLLIRQKVALLQSKRLYPSAGDIDHLEDFDYRLGMARIAKRDRHAPSMMGHRAFNFKPTSRYKALIAHDHQYSAIAEYMQRFQMPVYYLFYNPPLLPLRVTVPLLEYVPLQENPLLGARVVPYADVAQKLKAKKKGYAPSIKDLAASDPIDSHGWRLEYFMADLLLSCRQGRRFTDSDHADMQNLFFRRTGPIAATVAITVEVPKDVKLPE